MLGQNLSAAHEDSKTFVFSSNRRGTTFVYTLRQSHLRALLVLGLIGFVMAAVAVVDYVALWRERGLHAELERENRQLKFRAQQVKSQLHSLEQSLAKVESTAAKIQRITNLKDRNHLLRRHERSIATVELNHEPAGPKGGPLHGALPRLAGEIVENPPSSRSVRDENSQSLIPGEFTVEFDSRLAKRIAKAIDHTQSLEQKVLGLIESLVEQQSLLASTPSIRPTFGWYSSKFGYRMDPFTRRPALHSGVDFAAAPGTSVWATADGVVKFAGYQSGYGQIVILDHGYGVETRYAHNSRVQVSTGERVRRRQAIAVTGSSGRSTGPHLHYEVRIEGSPVDPANYILELE